MDKFLAMKIKKKKEGTNKYCKRGHNYRGTRVSNGNKRILSTTLWQYIWKLGQYRYILRKI